MLITKYVKHKYTTIKMHFRIFLPGMNFSTAGIAPICQLSSSFPPLTSIPPSMHSYPCSPYFLAPGHKLDSCILVYRLCPLNILAKDKSITST